MVFDDMRILDDDMLWATMDALAESDHTGDESLDNLPNVFARVLPVPPDVQTHPAG